MSWVRATDPLLDANVKLVSSGLNEAVVLQRAVIGIVGASKSVSARAA